MNKEQNKKSNKNSRKKIVLLDAYAIIHRAYHALPDFTSAKGEPTGGLYGTISMLLKIADELKPDYLVACYDLPEETFRKGVYENYKANRKEKDDDLTRQIELSRDIFKAFNVPIYEKAGFEADDILGTLAEQVKKEFDVVIASGDMDTMQLVDDKQIVVYTLKKGIKDTVLYDEDAVRERFGFSPKSLPDFKGLRGDPSDNIIGIKGVGEKTATILIQKFETIENLYENLKKNKKIFEEIKLTPRIIKLLEDGEEEAFFSKELATIRKDVPVSFETPKSFWKEGVDLTVVQEVLGEFGFRSLVTRVKNIFSEKSQEQNIFNEIGGQVFNSETDCGEMQKIGIALWLVNSNLTNSTLGDILNYAGTQDFEKAKEKILAELKEKDLEGVWKEIELPIIDVVKKMGERGIRVDKNYLNNLSQIYHRELQVLEKKIWEQAGEEFNINSPKQVGEILFVKMGINLKNHKKTSGGVKSTNVSVLEQLREDYPIVENILKHRELQKLLSTYIDNLPKMLDNNNRLHTEFLQSGTTTGRMASKEPNLQNIPIKTELGKNIRKAFVAEKDFKLVAFDYSQIELRLAALLSGDKKLIDIFKKGEDVHTAVAGEVFGVSLSEVDYEMRRKAKVINFGILYGMGVNSLRKSLGEKVTREEAQNFYNKYFIKFLGLSEYLDRVKHEVKETTYTKTFFGRRRYFEGINSKIPFIKAMAERMSINAPIQGTSADMIKIAMGRLDDYIKKNKLENDVFLLLQVHDELVFEIRESLLPGIVFEIKKIMENVIEEKDSLGIKFLVDVAVGDHWGNLERV